MLGIGRAAVVTPPGARRNMHRRRPRLQQSRSSRPQRRARRQHIVHQQDATSGDPSTGDEARPSQPLGPPSPRLHCSANPAQQPPRPRPQRPASSPRQHLRLIEPTRPPMRRRRRRPRHQLDRCRPRTGASPCRSKVGQRQRVPQPAGNSALPPVLERMNELPPHPVMRKQERRRTGPCHHRRLRINKRLDTPRTRAPAQRPTPRTANLEQHAPDRTCSETSTTKEFRTGQANAQSNKRGGRQETLRRCDLPDRGSRGSCRPPRGRDGNPKHRTMPATDRRVSSNALSSGSGRLCRGRRGRGRGRRPDRGTGG